MKYILISVCIFFIQFYSLPQKDRAGLSQLWLGIEGVESGEEVIHYISAKGVVWGNKQNENFLITNDPRVYNSSDTSIGNYYPTSLTYLAEFNWIWVTGTSEARWGLGLYKITNSKEPLAYFYLDARDSNYGNKIGFTSPDIRFYYDMDGFFKFAYPGSSTIYIGDLVRVSDLLEFTYTTSGLQSFWSNVLVCVSSDPDNNNVRLIWGKHPTFNCTSYKISRSIQIYPVIKYSVIATVNSITFEYIDEETSYYGSQPVYYYVRGYNGSTYSERSNVVSTPIRIGYGKSTVISNNKNCNFTLYQNSPNPFNPTTNIIYQISESGYTSLKVYDILGNEISALVDEYKEAGRYTIKFDGNELTSGVYLYTLRSGSFIETRKMLLIR